MADFFSPYRLDRYICAVFQHRGITADFAIAFSHRREAVSSKGNALT